MSVADFHAIYLADRSEVNLGRLLSEVRRVALSEARRLKVHQDDVEDVAQGVMLKVWNQLADNYQIRSIATYTRRTTRNLILNGYRDKGRVKRGGGLVQSLTGCPEGRFAIEK